MKNLKISTVLLFIALLSMSMGFPHQATDEAGTVSSSSYSGFMSCSPRHSQVKQEVKPIPQPQVEKCDEDGKTEEVCKEVSTNLVNHSAKVIEKLLKK